MKKLRIVVVAALAVLVALPAAAVPVTGVYTSTDLGGLLLTGRASTWRPGINSGLPHVLHGQSWNGVTLGTQWEMRCAVENTNFSVQDNRVNGVGTVVYTSVFNGGTFILHPGGWPWGDGTGTLAQTTLISTVQFVMIGGVSTPVASVVNGNSSGMFAGGCRLTFVIANGTGVGETTSLNPLIVKPPDYPMFLDGSCNPAPPAQQFGTWGNVITITMSLDCTVPVESGPWSHVKALYR